MTTSDADSNRSSMLTQLDSQARKILRPYNTFRNIYGPRTALVIASENCLNIPEDLKTFTEGDNPVSVRFSTKIPLQSHDRHPPIDVIVLVCQVFNKHSLKTIKDCIPYIDARYFAGKCFLLVTSDTEYSSKDIEDIHDFADSYLLPVHCVSKVKSSDGKSPPRLQLPSSLMSIYCPPVGCDVNSMIIDAAMMKGFSMLKGSSSLNTM